MSKSSQGAPRLFKATAHASAKAGAVRHRKAASGNTVSPIDLKKPQIKRLAQRAGFSRITGFEKVQAFLFARATEYTNELVKKSMLLAAHAKRKTIKEKDVIAAIKTLNAAGAGPRILV